MKSPFDRFLPPASKGRSRKGSRKAAELQAEPLEKRAMMAIFAYDRPGGDTLIAIDGNGGLTDLYMRGTLGGVQFATNSAFTASVTSDPLDWTNSDLNGDRVPDNLNLHVRQNGRPLYITNATPNELTIPLTEANGFTATDTASRTQFSLANGNLDYRVAGAFTGRLSDPQTGNSWTFTNTANGTLTFTPVGSLAAGPTPTTGRVIPGSTDVFIRGRGQRGSVVIDWSIPVSTFQATCPRLDSVNYTYNGQTLIGADGVTLNFLSGPGNGTETDVRVSTGGTVGFALPSATPKDGFGGSTVRNGAGINTVPGTSVLSGTITVYDVLRTGESDGSPTQTLTFGFTNASGSLVFTANQPNDWLEIAPGSTLASLQFVTRFPGSGTIGLPGNGGTPAAPAGQPALPGRVTISGSERWFEYTVEARATTTTVWAGFDVQSAITVDATRPGGGFNVLSPIVNAASLTLRGPSTVNFAAPTSVSGGISLLNGQVSGTSRPEVITTVVDAPIAASNYSLRVAGDSITVSPSGSLSGALPDAAGQLSQAAGSVSVQLLNADLFVQGTIFATNQFYEQIALYTRPLSLSTVSAATGLDSGLIRGGTVVVSMAAQGSGATPPNPTNADSSFHVVDLRTQVDTFRTRAAGTGTVFPGQNMHPYLLSVREADAVTFDAVAGSSRPISLSAGGSIVMGSALDTVSDVKIVAVSATGGPTSFTVSAPIQTQFGTIEILAGGVDVRNSVRVTNAALDAARNDITITASNGDIVAQNLLSAVNNVSLVQRKSGGGGRIVADGLRARSVSVDAAGDVTLGTTVETLSGQSGGAFSVRESDDISIPSLRAGGRVALSAAGVDGSTTTANPIALTARMDDVTALEISTPNGSADVIVNTPRLLTVGGAANPAVANMLAAGNVTIRSTAGEMRVLDAPLAGGNARGVKAASTVILAATYAPGTPNVTAATLTGTGNINSLAAFDGQTLVVGDRVLVRLGSSVATPTMHSNGIYVVARLGGGVGTNANWQLTRAADADTQPELASGSYVRVNTGNTLGNTIWQLDYLSFPATAADLSSATEIEIPTNYSAMSQLVVGQAVSGAGIRVGATIASINTTTGVITLSPNAVSNVGGSTVVSFGAPALGASPITVTQRQVTTNIGSDGLAKAVTFLVSSTGGTNSDAGSLGKMIHLYQQNDTSSSTLNPGQLTNFEFAALSGPIRLTQELPQIVRPIAIIGKGAVIDGSQITTTRTGDRVAAGTEINAFEFASGSGQVGTTPGASISGLTIGGFASGAAIKIDSAAGVGVSEVKLGVNPAGERLANRFGVLVTGSGAGAAISGSDIMGSTQAGVRVQNGAAGIIIVGSRVGAANRDNLFGLDIAAGRNQIGVVGDARNVVQFNRTGILLRGGVNSVVNTSVANNSIDGISIDGGSNAIGASKSRDQNSNAVYGNGRWGIRMASAAVARLQRIAGNFFGTERFGATPGKNFQGNVAVGNSAPASNLGLTPDKKTGVDKNGNQHSDLKGPAPKPRVTRPWRARR
jgi:hypothetical protein